MQHCRFSIIDNGDKPQNMQSSQSRMSFYSYHAGEVPLVRRVDTDYELPVVGFKNNLAVVVAKKKTPPPKTLVMQTDAVSGKKFLVVKGKRVEVKEVMKVKKKVTAMPLVLVDKTTTIKKTSDAQTSTDDLFEHRTIAVQTECVEEETNENYDFEFSEREGDYIIREDVAMGQGPKCPTPQNNYYLQFQMPPPLPPSQNLAVKPNTREEQIMAIIKRDFEDCENFDRSGNMFVVDTCVGFPWLIVCVLGPYIVLSLKTTWIWFGGSASH